MKYAVLDTNFILSCARKKIDFTLQELFREINTMSSKCADTIMSNLAITIKVELEKAREQAQNIV